MREGEREIEGGRERGFCTVRSCRQRVSERERERERGGGRD